jgi:hypothetical protein
MVSDVDSSFLNFDYEYRSGIIPTFIPYFTHWGCLFLYLFIFGVFQYIIVGVSFAVKVVSSSILMLVVLSLQLTVLSYSASSAYIFDDDERCSEEKAPLIKTRKPELDDLDKTSGKQSESEVAREDREFADIDDDVDNSIPLQKSLQTWRFWVRFFPNSFAIADLIFCPRPCTQST